MNINNNINSVRQKVPAGCKLIAVSKTQPVEKILEAYEAGQRIFGENKVQELISKHAALPTDIEWHMIGHLQSNKVRQLVPFVSLIHGVDSFKLLEEINRQSEKISKITRCLLQIFIASEETKFGFDQQEVLDLIASGKFPILKNIKVEGLMGMATFTDKRDVIRSEFKSLKRFFDRLKQSDLPANISMNELSMGMSGDFDIAVEEGSTLVRIGTAIFGSRNNI
jgi:pyridoxal phosphate enzyme (YggS family)